MNSDTSRGPINLLFVCQPGRLELLSRLLVASIARHQSSPFSMTACVPKDSGGFSRNTHAVFERNGVRISEFEPILKARFGYPIGNKLDALYQFSGADQGITAMMDSDLIALAALDPPRLKDNLGKATLGACLIFGPQVFVVGNRPKFDELGARLGLKKKIRDSPIKKRINQLEAFNAGFVVTADADTRRAWYKLTEMVLADTKCPEKFRKPFADQVSLAFLRAELGSSFSILDRRWNIGHVAVGVIPFFFHYHSLGVLLRHRFTNKLLRSLVKEYMELGVDLLGEMQFKDLLYFTESRTIVSDAL